MVNQRTHIYAPISGPDQASLLNWASIRVYEIDGVTPYAGTIYRSNVGTLTFPNPFVVSPALVDIWFDDPVRIVLGVTNNVSKVEQLTPVYDASQDADQAVFTPEPLNVTGGMVANGLFRSTDANTATWFQPGLSPHDHHGTAPNTTRLNIPDGATSRIASFVGTTTIGYGPSATYANPKFFTTFSQLASRGTWGFLSGSLWQSYSGSFILNATGDMSYSCMYGYGAYATTTAAIAFGSTASVFQGNPSSSVKGPIAIGSRCDSASGSVVIGQRATVPLQASLDFSGLGDMVTLGKNAQGDGSNAISLGCFAGAPRDGFSAGFNSGGTDRVNPGSISLGVNSVLPSGSNDSNAPVLLLGTPDPAEKIPMIAGPLCYVPQHLRMQVPGTLTVSGSASVAAANGKVGFFGVTPVPRPSVGEVEPGTGIEALDNLVLALRSLGLLAAPNDLALHYDAEVLGGWITDKTPVTAWREPSGRHLMKQGASPTYVRTSRVFNGRPSVLFSSSARLVEDKPGASVTHYVIVASHPIPLVKVNESLVTLDTDDARDTVLAAATGNRNTGRWASTMSGYELDGLDQTANKRIQSDGKAHVYQASLSGGWPEASTVLGRRVGSTLPGWVGSVAEVIGLDETWTKSQVNSLTRGLRFKYHVNQDDNDLLIPAKALLVSQDRPGISVSLDKVTGRRGIVSGTVSIPDADVIGPLPKVGPHDFCRSIRYKGPVKGFWFGLSHALHQIEVYVLPTASTPLSAQYLLGRYEIDADNRWSSGEDECGEGVKFCRPVRKTTKALVDYINSKISAGLNAQVALYTEVGGVKTLETIVPLRPDYTFFGTVKRSGTVIAELRKVTDATVFATSRRNLPQTTIGNNAAGLRELAMIVLALVTLPPGYHFRAQQILLKLAAIQAADGSLPATVNVVNPNINDGAWASGPMSLIGVAALKYREVTGDAQFVTFAQKIADLLVSRVNVSGVPVMLPGSTKALALDAVGAYWLWDGLFMIPSARQAADALRGIFWQPELGRCARSIDMPVVSGGASNAVPDTTHDLWTDVWTGIFFHAIGDQEKIPKTKVNLGAFRRRNIPVQLPPSHPITIF